MRFIFGFIVIAIYFLLMVITDPLAHNRKKFNLWKRMKRLEEIDREIVQLQREKEIIEHSI